MAKNITEINEKIETLSFTQIQEIIFHTDVRIIANKSTSETEGFWPIFLKKFEDSKERELMIETILSKIKNISESNESTDSNTINFLNFLKAKTTLLKSENIFNTISQANKEEFYSVHSENGVKIAESAYEQYQLLSLIKEMDNISFEKLITDCKATLNKIVEFSNGFNNSKWLENQFSLYKIALEQRQQKLPDNKDYQIDILLKLGSYGPKIKNESIKVEALKFTQDAYNIIYEKPLTKDSAAGLKRALEIMEYLYREFGDDGKAKFLGNQIESLNNKYNLVEQKETNNENKEKTECLLLHVFKQGGFDQKILDVKKQIQKTILDKIQEAAAIGKWVNTKLLGYEYGVSGYLDEKYLKSQLDKLNDKEGANYKIALELCFEAINIGIMNSVDKNPTCATIFCQKYPGTIKDIIQNHPEYFTDGHILKTSLIKASEHSKSLIKEDVEEQVGYNKHFEKAVMPVIAKYGHNTSILSNTGFTNTSNVTNDILEPIKNSIVKGESLETTKLLLKSKLDNKYILDVLGRNFTHIDDVYNIVKIMAFQTMAETICKIKSKNFDSIEFFNTQFPELAIRIKESHPEYYFEDKHIKEICRSFVELEKKKIEQEEEKKRLEIIEKERLKEQELKKIEEEKQQKLLEEQKKKEEEEKKQEQKQLENPPLQDDSVPPPPEEKKDTVNVSGDTVVEDN